MRSCTAEMIRALAPHVPVLGVCLGHQAIAAVFGARVIGAPRLMHGRSSMVLHDGEGILARLPSPLEVVQQHAAADRELREEHVQDPHATDHEALHQRTEVVDRIRRDR